MLFYEPLFLFLFGPAVYLIYLFFGEVRTRRALILLAASVVFYAWSEPVFIFLVFASVALDLYVAQKLAALSIGDPTVVPDSSHQRSDGKSRLASEAVMALDSRSGLRPAGNDMRKRWLALGVVANLAILVYYKYTGFLALNLDALLKAPKAMKTRLKPNTKATEAIITRRRWTSGARSPIHSSTPR